MTDRTLLNNGKGSIIKCPSDYNPSSLSEFIADLKNGMFVDINPNNSTDSDAGVSEIGTPLNKEHLLTDAVAQGFGFDASDDTSINDVLNRIGNDYLEATLSANQTQLVFTDSRIKATSTVDVYTDNYKVSPKNVVVANGTITMTFKAQTTPTTIRVRVY